MGLEAVTRLLFKLGLTPQDRAFDTIHNFGGIRALIDEAKSLRESGDATALVAEWRSQLSNFLMVELLSELEYRPGSHTPWESRGVGFGNTPGYAVMLRVTTGNSWSYINGFPKNPTWEQMREYLAKARSLSRHQTDYRFGEGNQAGNPRLRNRADFRVIYPHDLLEVTHP